MVGDGTRHDVHVGALSGQPLGDTGADAPAGAGDKGPAPGEAGTVELGHELPPDYGFQSPMAWTM